MAAASSTSLSKSEQKQLDMDEAKRRGVSYDQVKRERRRSGASEKDSNDKNHKKRRTREADQLDRKDNEEENKRLRTYSQDNLEDTKRRRTRSMDAAEEKKFVESAETELNDDEWRKEHAITVRVHGSRDGSSSSTNTTTPSPYRFFKDAPFNHKIQDAFTRAGFEKPTAIQSQCWPIALQGKDMICIAKTGSGKTCGFLLPCFHQFLKQQSQPRQGYAKAVLLVLAPTRELSVQIMEEAQKFGRHLGIRSVCCYGGAPKYPQIGALERGVEVIIATPGRLNDLLEMKKADLSQIQYLVLDEADRMLDMGFEPQIRSIVKHIPKDARQTLLFSATWPREIQALAHDFLKDPIQINVGEVNALVANKDIEQTIVMCDDDDKFDKLTEILKELKDSAAQDGNAGHEKVIVFVAKKVSCNDLANRLWDDGFAVDSLHGDRPQWERTRVMQAFKSGQLRMLIATDVAARGLDVKDVGVVVNYDMPTGVNGVEDYVHRIGRTGRAGKKGRAYTFFTKGDKKCATQLVEVLRKAEQNIPESLQAMVRPRFGGRGGFGGGGRGYMSSRGGGRSYMDQGRGFRMGAPPRSGGGRGGGFRRGGGGGGRGRGGFGGRGGGGRR